MYGIHVPKNVAHAKQIDEANGNTNWLDALRKETEALLEYKTFQPDDRTLKELKGDGYQKLPLRAIFTAKACGRHKARLVIGGHLVDSEDLDVYASNMKTVSSRVLLTIAAANDLTVVTGDIKNAYLYAYTKEKICITIGEEFAGVEGFEIGAMAIVVKALYGLPSSAHEWHAVLSDTMRSMGFSPTRYDNDVWIKERKGEGYDYIGTHTDDLLICAKDADPYIEQLTKHYTIPEPGPPSFHLGCDYKYSMEKGKMRWSLGSVTYVRETTKKVEDLLGEELGKHKVPMTEGTHPENIDDELLGEQQHRLYQKLIGMAQWLVCIGRIDIGYALTSLNRFSAAPRQGHLKLLRQLFGYLKYNPSKRIVINPEDKADYAIEKMISDGDCWKEQYPGAQEDVDSAMPKPMGVALQTSIFFDADHAHDQVTRRSVSGVIVYVGSTPVDWLSKRQGAVAASSYAAEFAAGRTATEEAFGLRYMLRCLGVPLKGRTLLIGDNKGMLQSCSKPGSVLKKKNVAIAFHMIRESAAAEMTEPSWIPTDLNEADALTKALGPKDFHPKVDGFLAGEEA